MKNAKFLLQPKLQANKNFKKRTQIVPNSNMKKQRRTDFLDFLQDKTLESDIKDTSYYSPGVTYIEDRPNQVSPTSLVDQPEVINWNNFLLEKVVNLFRKVFTIVSYFP